MLDFINSTLDPISVVLGLFGSFGALLAWRNTRKIKKNVKREKKRLDEPINIIIIDKESNEEKKEDLPGKLRRGDLTRAELLGYIGMVPIKKDLGRTRFELSYPSTSDFFEKLQRIQKGSGEGTLEIECTAKEYAQFDFDALCRTQGNQKESNSSQSEGSSSE